jgi:hypothetical protein
MQFSIKWLLAAFVYVALAAAALATSRQLIADLVWAVTGLAFGYAVVVSIIACGKRQAVALGFVVTSALYVFALMMAPGSASSHRAFVAVGYVLGSDGTLYEYDVAAPAGGGLRTLGDFTPAIRASNAVATMAAGLIGCCLGAMAFRHGCSDS